MWAAVISKQSAHRLHPLAKEEVGSQRIDSSPLRRRKLGGSELTPPPCEGGGWEGVFPFAIEALIGSLISALNQGIADQTVSTCW